MSNEATNEQVSELEWLANDLIGLTHSVARIRVNLKVERSELATVAPDLGVLTDHLINGVHAIQETLDYFMSADEDEADLTPIEFSNADEMHGYTEQVVNVSEVADDPEPSLNEFDIAELFSQDERSLRQIADDAGLSPDTLKRFVEGVGKPRNKTLRGLEKAFNLGEGTMDVFA